MGHISERIRELRKSLNLSQDEFASELGVTRAHISNLEKGHASPSEQLLKLIGLSYGISTVWLKTGVGAMQEGYGQYVARQREVHLATFLSEMGIFRHVNLLLLPGLVNKLHAYAKGEYTSKYGPLSREALDLIMLTQTQLKIDFENFLKLTGKILSRAGLQEGWDDLIVELPSDDSKSNATD